MTLFTKKNYCGNSRCGNHWKMEIEKILLKNVCWFDHKPLGVTYFEFDMHRLHISEIIPDYAKHF